MAVRQLYYLIRQPGDDREQQQPLHHAYPQVRPPQQRVDEHRQHQGVEHEGSAAAQVVGALLQGLGRLQGQPVLVEVDGLVLGPVILVEAPDILQQRGGQQVEDEDGDAQQALHQVQQDHVAAAVDDQRRQPGGQGDEEAHEEGQGQGHGHGELQPAESAGPFLLPAALIFAPRLLLRRQGYVRRFLQRPEAQGEHAAHVEDAADEGLVQAGVAQQDGVQGTALDVDVPVRLAYRQGPVGAGAHHHALDHRLPAHAEIVLRSGMGEARRDAGR